jgi:protein-export membrane protein SecD
LREGVDPTENKPQCVHFLNPHTNDGSSSRQPAMSKGRAVAKVLAQATAVIALATLVAVFVFPGPVIGSLTDWLLGREGPQVVFEVEPDGRDLQEAVEESIKVIKRRFYDMAKSVTVEREGPAHIVVRLGPSDPVAPSIALLARRGRFELRLIDSMMTAEQALATQPPPNSEVLFDTLNAPHLVGKEAFVSTRDVVAAHVAFHPSSQEPVVQFTLDSGGTRRFAEVTQANVGKRVAVVFDGKVLSAPVIRTPILGGTGSIEGGFTQEQATAMTILLRGGELPGRLRVVEQRAPKEP